jgi:hypothetical protein
LVNDDCPDLKNDFEWRVKHSPNSPLPPGEWFPIYNGSTRYDVRNPFNTDISSLDYSYLAANHGSNYHPEDGWELLKMDFGMLSNIGLPHSTDPGRNTAIPAPKLPYFILYNKYSGTFRFFGTLLGQMEGYETIEIELRIPKISPGADERDRSTNLYQDDLKATNLLSIAGEAVQPLDQETDENVMVVFAKATNDEETFFWFDIPVAYDPCLCNIRSQLDITFSFVQTATLKLNGSLEGGINTIKEPLTQKQYAKKMTANVLAVAVSTLVAVKTGGTVVNFQAYADFVNLLANKPNSKLSPKQLEDLKKLGGYLDCGAKFGKVIQGNYSDVIGKDNKKAIKAGNNILEANTTFLSSLGNGCSKKDNAATTITGAMELTGTWTKKDAIPSTEIKLAMPGSNWTDKTMGIVSYSESNGKRVPAYPTYNERLGTFALLETPKAKYSHAISLDLTLNNNNSITLSKSARLHRIELTDNILKYTFNPKLNVNINKTVILCRYVIKNDKGLKTKRSHSVRSSVFRNNISFSNQNADINYNSLYPFASAFVPIEEISDMPFIFITDIDHKEPNQISKDQIFIQFKILMISNDLSNQEEIQSIYLYTYPLSILEEDLNDPHFVYNNLLSRGVTLPSSHFELNTENLTIGTIYNDPLNTSKSYTIVKTGDLVIDEHIINHNFTSQKPNLVSLFPEFKNQITYTDDKTFAYDGIVTISANLSSIPGKKVKIYATMGFELLPGAFIGPNIELIVGYPFKKTPQPPQTFEQVASFCADNNKYKAQNFTNGAILEEQREYIRRKKEKEANEQHLQNIRLKNEPSIFPNPNTGTFQISFAYDLSDDAKVSVLDITGRTVLTQNINALTKSKTIQLTDVKNGIYFVTITQNGHKTTHKIMVNKE